jgi:hypothetical protein
MTHDSPPSRERASATWEVAQDLTSFLLCQGLAPGEELAAALVAMCMVLKLRLPPGPDREAWLADLPADIAAFPEPSMTLAEAFAKAHGSLH